MDLRPRCTQGPNTARFCDPDYDRLFAQQSTLTDRQARRAAFVAMQRALAAAVTFAPLVYRGDYSATNPAVRDWNPNMLFEFSNSNGWDVVPHQGVLRLF